MEAGLSPVAGGLHNLTALRWVVNDTRHGMRLQTRWGQPGHVHDVLTQQWRLSDSVTDMLSIETGGNGVPVRYSWWHFLHRALQPVQSGHDRTDAMLLSLARGRRASMSRRSSPETHPVSIILVCN